MVQEKRKVLWIYVFKSQNSVVVYDTKHHGSCSSFSRFLFFPFSFCLVGLVEIFFWANLSALIRCHDYVIPTVMFHKLCCVIFIQHSHSVIPKLPQIKSSQNSMPNTEVYLLMLLKGLRHLKFRFIQFILSYYVQTWIGD